MSRQDHFQKEEAVDNSMQRSDIFGDTAYVWCGNFGISKLIEKSLKSAIACGIPADKITVYALDNELCLFLKNNFQAISITLIHDDLIKQFNAESDRYNEYGTAKFNSISFLRYLGISDAMNKGAKSVLYIDADVILFSNPMSYFYRTPEISTECVLVQSDKPFVTENEFHKTYNTGELIIETPCCTGFALWRNKNIHKQLIQNILSFGFTSGFNKDDQHAFNVLKRTYKDDIQILPDSIFINGDSFKKIGPRIFENNVVSLHANFIKGNENKLKLIHDIIAASGVSL